MGRLISSLAREPAASTPVATPAPGLDPALVKAKLKHRVGSGGANAEADVAIVRALLNNAGYDYPRLEVAIRRFQRVALGMTQRDSDGGVDPGGVTFTKLKDLATTGTAPVGNKPTFWATDDWENVLPEATRTQKAKKPTLDTSQESVLAAITANRAALPDLMTGHETTKGNGGYTIGESRPADENATPTDITNETDPALKRNEEQIWNEIGSEAALEGVQTYDDQGWGWGKGWSALGSMTAVMENLFAIDAAAEKLLFDAGIALAGGRGQTFKVVNPDTGVIESGDAAVQLMRRSPKLLTIFVTLGRDPAHRQNVTDAQWRAIPFPTYAHAWPEDTVRFMTHAWGWAPALAWGGVNYSGTHGDLLQCIKLFAYRVAGHYSKQQPNGAWVVPPGRRFADPDARLGHWNGGSGLRALKAGAPQITVTDEQMSTQASDQPGARSLSGHVLIPVTKGGTVQDNTYFDLGAV